MEARREREERDILKLSQNSSTFSKKENEELTKKIKDISSATSIALASRTALILAPTLGIKIAIAGAIAGVTGYKLIKEAKYKKVISREIECNRVIEKLELTFDKNGKIIDTRFSQSVQELIRDYFKECRPFCHSFRRKIHDKYTFRSHSCCDANDLPEIHGIKTIRSRTAPYISYISQP